MNEGIIEIHDLLTMIAHATQLPVDTPVFIGIAREEGGDSPKRIWRGLYMAGARCPACVVALMRDPALPKLVAFLPGKDAESKTLMATEKEMELQAFLCECGERLRK